MRDCHAWDVVFRENLADFTRSSFFSQQHLEKMRGPFARVLVEIPEIQFYALNVTHAILTAWAGKFLPDLYEKSLQTSFSRC